MKITHGVKSKFVRDAITGKRHQVLEGEDFEVKTKFAVTPEMIDQFVDLYREGMLIKDIAKRLKRTPSVLYHWIDKDSSLKERLSKAEASRALFFKEKGIESARNATGKDDTPAERLRFDAYRWAAEVGDPTKYGKKLTHQGNPEAPIQFIVNTGFPEPNEHQKHPQIGSDGLIQKVEHKEEG